MKDKVKEFYNDHKFYVKLLGVIMIIAIVVYEAFLVYDAINFKLYQEVPAGYYTGHINKFNGDGEITFHITNPKGINVSFSTGSYTGGAFMSSTKVKTDQDSYTVKIKNYAFSITIGYNTQYTYNSYGSYNNYYSSNNYHNNMLYIGKVNKDDGFITISGD
ncbi:MAG: hypothetical protein CfClM3_1686 [Methanobrevibacter sp. CfCl-M3]